MFVKFKKSPTGAFNLAYNVGDIVEAKNFDKELLKDMEDKGFVKIGTKAQLKEKAETAKSKEVK